MKTLETLKKELKDAEEVMFYHEMKDMWNAEDWKLTNELHKKIASLKLEIANYKDE